MATTTTNFNFPIPQSTDLVKDGATAIAALGTSIDTDFVDLKGGTTGQVLSKASGTDLDFTWVAQDDSNAIQNAIVDAKGDLISATAADTPARLAVGTNGQVLTADSTASTGLAWATVSVPTSLGYAAGKNPIINGDFKIWQRGTSFTFSSSDAYTADRFLVSAGSGGTVTVSQQTFTPGAAPVSGYEGSTYLQAAYSVSGTGCYIYQKIEDVRAFAGQTVTVSFWARITSGTKTNCFVDVVQNFGSGGSATAVSNSTDPNFTLTTTWTRFTQVVPVASISGKTIGTSSFLYPRIQYGTSGTSTFQFWGVQVEAGSSATTFQTASGSIQGELALAQRYYWRATGATVGWLIGTSSTAFEGSFQMPVTFRSSASSIEWSSMRLSDGTTATNATAITLNAGNTTATNTYVTGTVASGLTQYRPYILNAANSSAYIGFSAEL